MALTPAFQMIAYVEDIPDGDDFLIKSDDGTPIEGKFSAILSTEDRDGQGDEVDQDGLDVEHFIKSGHFNYEHGKGPANIIGYPTHAEKITLDSGKKATRVHGCMYLKKALGLETYNTMKAMSKSGGGRRLGLSVEGPVFERDATNKRRIKRSKVTNAAITANPANPYARVDMVKSLTSRGYMLKSMDEGVFEEPEEDKEEKDDIAAPNAAESPTEEKNNEAAEDGGIPEPYDDDDGDDGDTDDAALPPPPEADAVPALDMPETPAAPAASAAPQMTAGDIALILLQHLPDVEHNTIVQIAQALFQAAQPVDATLGL